MAFRPNLRVIVDGDTSRVYREGDQVKGRVSLVLEDEQEVEGLKLSFTGTCTTKTTRPFYVSGNDSDACMTKREYVENVSLFNFEQDLASAGTYQANKYSWDFNFVFPHQTEALFSRWAHGAKYFRKPHPLPPTFKVHTNIPGGRATVSYQLEAQLILAAHKSTKKVIEKLRYLPSSRNTPLEAKIMSRCLYAQNWKPHNESKSAMDKLSSKFSRKRSDSVAGARIVPTLHMPGKIAPAQHIPLLFSLENTGSGSDPDCILDSLAVNISTYTTSICGQPFTQPEDIVSKHVTCISKHDIHQLLSFSTPIPLTTNFRLVDDAECVPTFKSYTITRHYTITVIIGITCQDQKLTIRSTAPLEILPKIPLSELRDRTREDDDGDIDPLPLYMPREPSREFAPDYAELYSLSPTSMSYSLALVDTRSSSFASGTDTPSTAPTTPGYEIEQPIFERPVMRVSGGST